MEIGVKGVERVTFSPDFKTSPEVIAALSMATVKVGDYYQALLRQVQLKPDQQLNRGGELAEGKVPESVLAFVMGKDGVNFDRSGVVALRPSEEPGAKDSLAVEDPTIVKTGDHFYVFHSAVEPRDGGGVWVSMQVAEGDDLQHLGNKRVILEPREVGKKLGRDVDMVKEPEVIQMPDGSWRLFCEVAGGGKSRIATASASGVVGPYNDFRILLDTREEGFDSRHVSPGPVMLTRGGDILMLFNGCGNKGTFDATEKWSVGAVMISARGGVMENTRLEKPVVAPPEELGYSGKLVAFASSLVLESHEQKLYYHVADQRVQVARLDVAGI